MDTTFEVLTDTIMHVREVQDNLKDITNDIDKRGIVHDMSKFQEPEFSVFCETRPEFVNVNYGTPEYKAVCEKAKVAVDHHYENNRHHVAFHKDGIKDMNLLDVLEMLADWKAANKRSSDLSFEDSLPKCFENYKIDETLQNLIINTLKYLNYINKA